MNPFPVDQMPEGFDVVDTGPGVVTVIYDVTPKDFGTWTGVAKVGTDLHLFPARSYRHRDLAKRLGVPVPDED